LFCLLYTIEYQSQKGRQAGRQWISLYPTRIAKESHMHSLDLLNHRHHQRHLLAMWLFVLYHRQHPWQIPMHLFQVSQKRSQELDVS
jgi:hypothetical protein